ncbi:hypothetical protein CAPTEDRAFT_118408 [Capitella teleta]|uniref:Uncharacterized protein n=1 Tax=Capitella teleta TaxID=283909 RepID=R7VEF2_CAPTE|nr:hypothetical protein CAPTEDRAFT_118408 [Capitella teleta]|eukprot:ELU17019.1 hypothetical protein CAPTEDRAFT_118408 [Capitella teleta]
MYLPATDEPIQPIEVDEALKSFKPNKSGGPSGIAPGLLKMLPVTWVTFFAHLFTGMFFGGSYPEIWRFTKLVTLFKKGA